MPLHDLPQPATPFSDVDTTATSTIFMLDAAYYFLRYWIAFPQAEATLQILRLLYVASIHESSSAVHSPSMNMHSLLH